MKVNSRSFYVLHTNIIFLIFSDRAGKDSSFSISAVARFCMLQLACFRYLQLLVNISSLCYLSSFWRIDVHYEVIIHSEFTQKSSVLIFSLLCITRGLLRQGQDEPWQMFQLYFVLEASVLEQCQMPMLLLKNSEKVSLFPPQASKILLFSAARFEK